MGWRNERVFLKSQGCWNLGACQVGCCKEHGDSPHRMSRGLGIEALDSSGAGIWPQDNGWKFDQEAVRSFSSLAVGESHPHPSWRQMVSPLYRGEAERFWAWDTVEHGGNSFIKNRDYVKGSMLNVEVPTAIHHSVLRMKQLVSPTGRLDGCSQENRTNTQASESFLLNSSLVCE